MALFASIVLLSVSVTALAAPQRFFIPNQNGFQFMNQAPPQELSSGFFPPGFFVPEQPRPEVPSVSSQSEVPVVPPQLSSESSNLPKPMSPFDAMSHGFGSEMVPDHSSGVGHAAHMPGEIEAEEHPTTLSPTTTTTEIPSSSSAFPSIFDVVPSLNRTVDILRNILSLGRFRREIEDLESMESLVVPVAFMPDNSFRAEAGLIVKSGKMVGLSDGPLFVPVISDQVSTIIREPEIETTTVTEASTTESATVSTTFSQ
jgi:hypothetical protein